MAPKRGKPRKEVDSEEDGDEYRKKRDRNNMVSNLKCIFTMPMYLSKEFLLVGRKTKQTEVENKNCRNNAQSKFTKE